MVVTHTIDLSKIADDSTNTHDRRSNAIILLGEQQQGLATILKHSANSESYLRTAAARALGSHKGRAVFEPLLELMADTDSSVSHEAILSLGTSKDSRALFSLINYLQNPLCSTDEAIRRVFMAFELLNDPRASDFILKYGDNRLNEAFYGREEPRPTVFCEVKKALHSKKPLLTLYTFCGEETTRLKAEAKKRAKIESVVDIERIEKEIRELNAINHPQTYVIDIEGNLLLGGYIEEHVQVASGRDVLAAGEAFLTQKSGWKLDTLNNRSNGYYPDKSTIPTALEKFRKAGLVQGEVCIEEFPKQGYASEEILFDKPFYSAKSSDA